LNHGNARREIGFGRIAGESADVGAALYKLFDNVVADCAGSAGNEDGH
jgi:hypothetical protein